jgi:hypothetical protein
MRSGRSAASALPAARCSILDNKLDRQAAQPRPAEAVPVLHPNIRGPRYYH